MSSSPSFLSNLMTKGKNYFSGIKAGLDETNQLGPELKAAAEMSRINRGALQPALQPPAAAKYPASGTPAKVDLVNPGYKPVGGQAALDKILGAGGFRSVRRTQPGSSVGSMKK